MVWTLASVARSLERSESREKQLAEPRHEVIHESASMVIRKSALTDTELENVSGGQCLIVRTRMAPAAGHRLGAFSQQACSITQSQKWRLCPLAATLQATECRLTIYTVLSACDHSSCKRSRPWMSWMFRCEVPVH